MRMHSQIKQIPIPAGKKVGRRLPADPSIDQKGALGKELTIWKSAPGFFTGQPGPLSELFVVMLNLTRRPHSEKGIIE